MRIDALDDFAVELQHEPQHAMRRRMLRAEIDREIAKVLGLRCSCIGPSCFAFSSPGRRMRALPRTRENRIRGIPGQPHRLVDAPASPRRRSEPRQSRSSGNPCAADARRNRSRSGCAADPGWPANRHAEKVKDLALEPIGSGKDYGDARRHRRRPRRSRSSRERAG